MRRSGIDFIALLLDCSQRYWVIIETAHRITRCHLMGIESIHPWVARRLNIFVIQSFFECFEIKLVCRLEVTFALTDSLGGSL
jgi:hypothetical protein